MISDSFSCLKYRLLVGQFNFSNPPRLRTVDWLNATTYSPVTAMAIYTTTTNNSTTITTTTGDDPAVPQHRSFRGRVVKARDVHLPNNVLAFKPAREARKAMATWTGGLLGLVALGSLGAVIGASVREYRIPVRA
jgi:hypothetical protein